VKGMRASRREANCRSDAKKGAIELIGGMDGMVVFQPSCRGCLVAQRMSPCHLNAAVKSFAHTTTMTCEDVIVDILVVTRRPVDDTPEGTLGRITQVRSDPWGFTVLWDWALHRDRYSHSLWLDSAKLAAFERVTDEQAEAIRTRYYEEEYLSWRSP
jgi:hypothetical protein